MGAKGVAESSCPGERPPVRRSMSIFCSGGCGRRRRPGPDFYEDRHGYPRPSCKKCMYRSASDWRENNRDKHVSIFRRANHRANLRTRFGLTVDQFERLQKASNGVCAVCQKPERRKRRLSLDHDHSTGRLRGFVCSACNLLLGCAKDSAELLERAASYLRTAVLVVEVAA